MNTKRYKSIMAAGIAAAALLLAPAAASAQTELWAIGSAVPGGAQKLDKRPDGKFKFAGALNKGELKISYAQTPVKGTKYLAPRLEYTYIVNNGESYKTTTDSTLDGWIVPFQEDYYRFYIDPSKLTLTGEIFVPWGEMFIAGGAVSCGWQSFLMEPMTRDADDPCVWTWTGELKERTEYEQPKRFKIMGQDNWDPKSLHPFVQDESCLESTQLQTGGDDLKWQIADNGYYRITVNVFKETFKAEYLGTNARPSLTGVESLSAAAIKISADGGNITAISDDEMQVEVISTAGVRLHKASGKKVSLSVSESGVYIVSAKTSSQSVSRKIVVR